MLIGRTRCPGGEDQITDNYLLVKMCPLFRDAIDKGLASVLPDFLAEYGLMDFESDINDLPGSITNEDFLAWAAHNITVHVYVIIPTQEGFTKEDLEATMAPLEDSGNAFGAKNVMAEFTAYTQEGFEQWVTLFSQEGRTRTVSGVPWDFQDTNLLHPEQIHFWQTLGWDAA